MHAAPKQKQLIPVSLASELFQRFHYAMGLNMLERLPLEQVSLEDITEPALRERHLYWTKSSGEHTEHFVACDASKQVGFLAVDTWPTEGYLDICEIFIAKHLRRHKRGSRLLLSAEHLARERSFSYIKLTAKPLDDDISHLGLQDFYTTNGYKLDSECDEDNDQWVKILAPENMTELN